MGSADVLYPTARRGSDKQPRALGYWAQVLSSPQAQPAGLVLGQCLFSGSAFLGTLPPPESTQNPSLQGRLSMWTSEVGEKWLVSRWCCRLVPLILLKDLQSTKRQSPSPYTSPEAGTLLCADHQCLRRLPLGESAREAKALASPCQVSQLREADIQQPPGGHLSHMTRGGHPRPEPAAPQVTRLPRHSPSH